MLRKCILLLCSAYFTLNSAFAQAPKSYTSSEILLQLKKLNTVGSVLYIAAHPDDENTRLIAYLANEKCLRTGYLSLTRGDGGQNLIGTEQGIELGVVRTQELLAARRTDGGEQFFTRAYDFGFSKTPEETFRKWNHDSVLADVVWVIRNFRPDIIITRFATDGSGGHGHHTASAMLAEEAFDAAADPNKFPEQLKYVSVWKTRRMFHNSTARFFNPNADLSNLIRLDVGGYNPLLGKSYGEIAAESRSMHKSQGFGSAKQRGESFEYFKPIKGDTAGLKDIFQGIDFSWKRVEGSSKVMKSMDEAIRTFSTQHPEQSIKHLNTLIDFVNDKRVYNTKISWEHMKWYQAQELIASMSGLFAEVTTDQSSYAMNDTLKMNFSLINRTGTNATLLGLAYNGNDGKQKLPEDIKLKKDSLVKILNPQLLTYRGADAITQPYWLYAPLKDNLYQVGQYMLTENPYNSRGHLAGFAIDINNNGFSLYRKFQYKWTDPEKGELYRPLVITPPVMINMQNEVIAFPDTRSKEVKIVLKAGKDNVQGSVKLDLPAGWKAEPASANFTIDKKAAEQTLSFTVTPPATAAETMIKAIATVNGESYSKGIKEIRYDHIPVQTLFPEAEAKLIRLDVQKKLKKIGYIPGAGDEVQQCLSQLGYEVVTLTDEMLAKDNLQQYEAIVVGVRAYNTNEKLSLLKQRFMDYVNEGGNFIAQYNTNSFAGPFKGDIGPYPFKITRDRVTDEHAKVNFELPAHPVLNTPNKITDRDFEGWIQERCIYSAGDADAKYEMPLSMSDPNEKPNKGALLIAKHGKGYFVYTGLVFFRELPAGVPGAYRLFVNIIELGK